MLILGGCGVNFHKGPVFSDVEKIQFPMNQMDLLVMAHRSYHFNGPVRDVAISLLASEKVLARSPKNDLANLFATRAAYWLIEFGGKGFDGEELADHGLQYAKTAEAQDGSRVEYPFFMGVHTGFKMRESFRPQLINIRKTRDYFKRAIELDPAYDDGAPLRAMGILLIKSPSWPTGVGDVDEGVEYLQRAVKMYPYYPANHLYLAEGYMYAERYEDSLAELDVTKGLLENSYWGVPGDVWKQQTATLRAEVAKKLSKIKNKKASKQTEEPKSAEQGAPKINP